MAARQLHRNFRPDVSKWRDLEVGQHALRLNAHENLKEMAAQPANVVSLADTLPSSRHHGTQLPTYSKPPPPSRGGPPRRQPQALGQSMTYCCIFSTDERRSLAPVSFHHGHLAQAFVDDLWLKDGTVASPTPFPFGQRPCRSPMGFPGASRTFFSYGVPQSKVTPSGEMGGCHRIAAQRVPLINHQASKRAEKRTEDSRRDQGTGSCVCSLAHPHDQRRHPRRPCLSAVSTVHGIRLFCQGT